MTSRPVTAARRRPARGRGRSRAVARRRRNAGLVAVLAVTAAVVVVAVQLGPDAVRELTLPLKHEDVIRQQAASKNLDPALIAAVIYQESKFRDRTSSAGAKGLMQILPGTAKFIARKSGGTAFELRDLGTPQINIAYGSWYLRYLMRRYDGNKELAVAAYNAGATNVDQWVHDAGGPEKFDAVKDIPFPETRGYVAVVLQKQKEYRRNYGHELGIR